MTYGESQAWQLGLLQDDSPTREQREQIYFAAHALTNVLYGTKLTFEDFVAAWKRLFTGSLPTTTPTSAADPHEDSAHPPTVSAVNVMISSVMPLGNEVLGNAYQYPSQNTDRDNKWRISVGPVAVPATTSLFQVVYSTPFKRAGQAYVPVVTSQGLVITAVSVTPMGFSVQSAYAMGANTQLDVGFHTSGG